MTADPSGAGELHVAVVLYESTSTAADHEPLYEESFVLLRAGSADEARARAEAHAQRAGTSYRNQAGATVTWSLLEVVDVSAVLSAELDDGAELYARHFRDLAAYRRFDSSVGED